MSYYLKIVKKNLHQLENSDRSYDDGILHRPLTYKQKNNEKQDYIYANFYYKTSTKILRGSQEEGVD